MYVQRTGFRVCVENYIITHDGMNLQVIRCAELRPLNDSIR